MLSGCKSTNHLVFFRFVPDAVDVSAVNYQPEFRTLSSPSGTPLFKVSTKAQGPGTQQLGFLERDSYVDPSKRMEHFYNRGIPNSVLRHGGKGTPSGSKCVPALVECRPTCGCDMESHSHLRSIPVISGTCNQSLPRPKSKSGAIRRPA